MEKSGYWIPTLAVYEEVLQGYVETLQKAGLFPFVIDLWKI